MKAGITLIEVPFWWDDSSHTLGETISKERPELMKATVKNSAWTSNRILPLHSGKRNIVGLVSNQV